MSLSDLENWVNDELKYSDINFISGKNVYVLSFLFQIQFNENVLEQKSRRSSKFQCELFVFSSTSLSVDTKRYLTWIS